MPIHYIRTLVNGSTLALWHIKESEEELLSHVNISPRELEELHCIRSEKGRVRWLAVRKALNSLFTEDISECFKDEHGKPFVSGFDGYISLSHSNDYAIAMVHPNYSVGVDIEIIQPKIRRIVHKFLKDSEIEMIKGQHEIEKLYACWCAKEAVFKWQGKKGISLKQNIEISDFQYEKTGFMDVLLYSENYRQHLTVEYEEMDGYFLAHVCNA